MVFLKGSVFSRKRLGRSEVTGWVHARRRTAAVLSGVLLVVAAIGAALAFGAARGGAAVDPEAFGGFTVSVSSPQTAGTQADVTITALEVDGGPAVNYTGVHCVAFSGAQSSPNGTKPIYPAQGTCAAGSSLTFNSSGQATTSVTLFAALTTTLTVTDVPTGNHGSSNSFTVNPGPATHFSVPTPSTQTAGMPFQVPLTALDMWGNTATGYTGQQSVSFLGWDPAPNKTAPVSPVSVLFAAGKGTATITLFDAETISLTFSQGAIMGSTTSTFTVNPGSAASFSASTPSIAPTAGTGFQVSLTALDTWGNTATGYTGQQSVAFNGWDASPAGNKPSSPVLVTFAAGQGTASVTLFDAETISLTFSQGAIMGATGSFTVVPATLMPSFSRQPADTQVGQVIYSDQASIPPTPVEVKVADVYGNLPLNPTAVQMTAPATLGGTLTEPTSSLGVASFSSLTLPATGTYQLTATVGAQQKQSDPFQVVAHLQICNGASCNTGDVGNGSQTSNTTITAGGMPFQSLVLATGFVGGPPPNNVCQGFTPIPGTSGVEVEVEGNDVTASKPSSLITLTVTKATLKSAGLGNLGAAQFNVCLGAKGGASPWIDKFGGKAILDSTTGLYWGLVPDQSSSLPPNNPYIVSRNKTGSGNLVVVVDLSYPWDSLGYI
jgi:hypothetical protein